MTISNAEIEWFDDKFECNEPENNLMVVFHDLCMPNEEESKDRIFFSLDKFAQKYQYVMLGFSRELNIMAIKPVKKRVPGAYEIHPTSLIWTFIGIFPAETDTVLVTPEEFLKEFGLKHSETTEYDAEFDEDKQILLIAIDKDKLVKPSTSE